MASSPKQIRAILIDKQSSMHLQQKSRNRAELSTAWISLLSAKASRQKHTLFSSWEQRRSPQNAKRNSFVAQNSSVESMTRTGETLKDEAALPIKPPVARVKQENSSPRQAAVRNQLDTSTLRLKL